MSVVPSPLPLACDHGLRREAVVNVLVREVVQGRMRPGQHLVTRSLADRFGVSHTPVREALVALAGIGLVDLLPNRGAIVRRMTPGEVREILQVRRALECEAVRGAAGRMPKDSLDGLATEFRSLIARGPSADSSTIEAAQEADSRLHDAIAANCGNGFLAKELGRLKMLYRAFRDASWAREVHRDRPSRLVEEAGEHLAIVEALRSGDRRASSKAMSAHIRAGNKYWCRALPDDGPKIGDHREGQPR